MFADLPPPPPEPPAITAQQQSDVNCLRLGLFIQGLATGMARDPRGPRIVQIYLRRLQRTDDTRDWRQLAAPPPEIEYGAFMRQLRSCEPPTSSRRYRYAVPSS